MPQQKQFISSPYPGCAYIGGQGSGKTVALCTSLILNSLVEPNGHSLIGRLNYTDFADSTMQQLLELIPESLAAWHKSDKKLTFKNGHRVTFKHLDMADAKLESQLRSMSLNGAYVDEATEIEEKVYFWILGRLRRGRCVVRLTSNPSGHDWIWRHFFDPERKIQLQEENIGITATSMDNPFNPPGYVERMINAYPPDWADRYVYGNFSEFTGLVYKEFSELTHVWDVKKRWPIFGDSGSPPHNWPVLIGIDVGSDIDPWSIVIAARAPSGMLFQYAEVYGNNMLVSDIAAQVHLKIDGRKIEGIAYDYSNRQAGIELAECGINAGPADKDIMAGLMKTTQYFHVDSRLRHPFLGSDGAPWYYISSACEKTIQELLEFKWSKKALALKERESTSGDEAPAISRPTAHHASHSPDAIRYMLHTFRPLPDKLPKPRKWEAEGLDHLSREFWRADEQHRDTLQGYVPRTRQNLTIEEWKKLASRNPVRFQRPAYARYLRH